MAAHISTTGTDQNLSAAQLVRMRTCCRRGHKTGIVKVRPQGVGNGPTCLQRGEDRIGMNQNGVIKLRHHLIGERGLARI